MGLFSIFSPKSSSTQSTKAQYNVADNGGLAISTTGQVSAGLFGTDLQGFLDFLKSETATNTAALTNTIQQGQNPVAATISQASTDLSATIKQVALPVALVIGLFLVFARK